MVMGTAMAMVMDTAMAMVLKRKKNHFSPIHLSGKRNNKAKKKQLSLKKFAKLFFCYFVLNSWLLDIASFRLAMPLVLMRCDKPFK